jgi:hypothetical protein
MSGLGVCAGRGNSVKSRTWKWCPSWVRQSRSIASELASPPPRCALPLPCDRRRRTPLAPLGPRRRARTPRSDGRSIAESCLDVSFARTGGCLAVLAATKQGKIRRFLADKDLISNRQQVRTKLLSCVTNDPFHRLDRRLRQELLSMDGATILAHTGHILTAGSIVRVPSGSSGRGRKAAAIQLSRLGLAVKISADGPITGFRNKKEIFSL